MLWWVIYDKIRTFLKMFAVLSGGIDCFCSLASQSLMIQVNLWKTKWLLGRTSAAVLTVHQLVMVSVSLRVKWLGLGLKEYCYMAVVAAVTEWPW